MGCPLDHPVGCIGIHDIGKTVDDFIAADSENCCAENFLTFSVDQNLHEALRLAALPSAADARHHLLANQCLAAGVPNLGFCHTDPAQRRVDEQPIGHDAVRDPS